jgi:thymidine phosphorylase
MLSLASPGEPLPQARAKISGLLGSGQALERFRRMVEAQGGDPRIVDRDTLLPQSRHQHVVTARQTGFLAGVNARLLGIASMNLAGENKDPSTGLTVHRKIADWVEKGEPLCTVHYGEADAPAPVLSQVESAFQVRSGKVKAPPLIKQIIEG